MAQNLTTWKSHLKSVGVWENVRVAASADGYSVAVRNYRGAIGGLPDAEDKNAIAVVLFDPEGAIVWQKGVVAERAGADFRPADVAFDADGDVYVAGISDAGGDFGNGAKLPLPQEINKDYAFVVRLSRTDGQGVWARAFVSTVQSSAEAISVRGDDVAIAGTFYVEMSVDMADGSRETIQAGSGSPAYVAKLDRASGKARWVKRGQAQAVSDPGEFLEPAGVGFDGAGNVHVAGTVKGSLDGFCPPLAPVGTELNGFVVSLAGESGAPRWAKRFGSSTSIESLHVQSSASNDDAIVIGGDTPAGVDFGDAKPLGVTGSTDAFLAVLEASDGSLRHKLVVGGTGDVNHGETFEGVAIDRWGQAAAIGEYYLPFQVGGTTLVEPTKSHGLFAVKLDARGAPVWVKSITASERISGRSLRVDPMGAFVAGAVFQGENVNFGIGPVVTTGGPPDAVVLRWSP